MKVIFLDIDGVLNRNATLELSPSGCTFVEDRLIRRLKRIYYSTHAKIVLSSSWRLGWYDIAANSSETANAEDYSALSFRLMSEGIPIHSHTPILSVNDRAKEIAAYIRETPDIESFIIIDDISVDGFSERQIKTSPRLGLTDADADRAIKMLSE